MTITVPTARVTAKQNIIIEIYRNEGTNTNSTFYKITSTTSPLANDPTVDTVSFVDTLDDESIISNEIIYNQGTNQGGPLPYGPAPAGSIVATSNNRVFVAGLEDPLMFAFSHTQNIVGHGTEFCDNFRTSINLPGFNEITAIATLDGKTIFFSNSQICCIDGAGPDRNGQGSFNPPSLIPSDVGCVAPRSVVQTRYGVMFQSLQGIYLLTRDNQTLYVGAGVEAYNAFDITSAVASNKGSQIRFTTSDSRTLVLDTSFPNPTATDQAQAIGNWTTFTNHKGLAATNWNDEYVYMRVNGDVYKEQEGYYKDGNSTIQLLIQTAWFTFGDVQGYQQVNRAAFLAEYLSQHSLIVSIAYDYKTFFEARYSFPTADIIQTSTWGDGEFWGSTTPWGGQSNVYQMGMHLRIQKCEAIQFQFKDVGENGASYSLSKLSMDVGVHGKINRFKTDKQR